MIPFVCHFFKTIRTDAKKTANGYHNYYRMHNEMFDLNYKSIFYSGRRIFENVNDKIFLHGTFSNLKITKKCLNTSRTKAA